MQNGGEHTFVQFCKLTRTRALVRVASHILFPTPIKRIYNKEIMEKETRERNLLFYTSMNYTECLDLYARMKLELIKFYEKIPYHFSSTAVIIELYINGK